MRLSVVLLAALTLPGALPAQAWHTDLSAGFGADGRRVAISALREAWRPATRLSVAIGGRLTWYGGDTVDFALRDAEPACGDFGCIAATKPIAPSILGLNLFGEVRLRVARPVELGANLDLFGAALGADDAARWSLFLYGNRDRGSLNSEFFASVDVTRRMRLRGGLSHYVIGYQAPRNDDGGPERYQRFFNAVFIAVRIDP